MQAFNANVQARILFLVRTILEQNAIAAEVRADSRLVDIGLTSIDMVNLMLAVEAEFDFTIPQDQITSCQNGDQSPPRMAYFPYQASASVLTFDTSTHAGSGHG